MRPATASEFRGGIILHKSGTEFTEYVLRRIGRLLDGTAFYGVLVLIGLTAVPYGTVDPWWESIFEFAVFGFTILWLVEGSFRGAWWGKEHWILLPLFALVLFAIIQTLPLGRFVGGDALGGTLATRTISADPFETWRFSQKLLAITLTLGLLLRYASSERRLVILAYLVIGIGLASAVFGLFRSEMPQSLMALAGERLRSRSSYGQFENRNHFAFLMEMSLGLVLGLSIGDRARMRRLVLYVFSGLILWAALLLTHSRGGVLSLLLEIPFFFLLFSTVRNVAAATLTSNGRPGIEKGRRAPRLITSIVAVSLILAGVGASVVFIGGDETIRRLERTPNEFVSRTNGSPKVARPQIWKATLELIKANRFVGVGFAGYSMAIPRYLNASGQGTIQEAHNDYLELFASGGVVAAALGIWFFGIFTRLAKVRLRETTGYYQALSCGAIAGLFGVAVHSFFDFGLHITVNSLVCTGLIVLAVKIAYNPPGATQQS
ncbi:MAG: O-antigen ligase family protein [Pyrinomonadaceae bacterium]